MASRTPFLLAQTSLGSFVMDNLTDTLLCRDRPAHFHETRETPAGPWTRYDQRRWHTAPAAPESPVPSRRRP